MNPRSIPCRMCQAGPWELCKYKGVEHPPEKILGGHDARTPERHRCYHYKRVMDARLVKQGPFTAPRKTTTTTGCRWR